MSYENSEPKTLKTLNSDGQVLDDSGNVISDSTDYWKKTYNESEPKPDKILHSDGTIKDSAGNLIQGSTEFNIKKYNQAEPKAAKYLHSNGTIDENPGSGGGGGSWHNINNETIPRVDNLINSMDAIVSFRMKISDYYVKGSIMGGDGDGGTTVSACGMKNVDYWEQPANCFFDTGFDIGYTGELTWSTIATIILNAYNTSTGGSDTFTSFEVYY